MIKNTIQLQFDGNGTSLRTQIASIYKQYNLPWNKDVWNWFQDQALGKYETSDPEEYETDSDGSLTCYFCGHYGCKILWKINAIADADMAVKVNISNEDYIVLILPPFLVCGSECVQMDLSLRSIINTIKNKYPTATFIIRGNKINALALRDSLPVGGHVYLKECHLYNTLSLSKWSTWGEFSWDKKKMIELNEPILKAVCRNRRIWRVSPGPKRNLKDNYAFILRRNNETDR